MHLRNPFIIAWWSAAFPGFGHLLLSKYLRGFILIGWEMFINTQTHLNEAIVYTLTGQIEQVGEVLNIRWMSLYAPVYLFAIYDSYRTSQVVQRTTISMISSVQLYPDKPANVFYVLNGATYFASTCTNTPLKDDVTRILVC